MTLLDGWWLGLLVLVPLAIRTRRSARPPVIEIAPARAAFEASSKAHRGRARLRHLPVALRVIAITLAVVALARPVALEAKDRQTLGIDIVFCLDVSSSMAEEHADTGQTRCDVARRALVEFAARRPTDRIGAITFAAYADLVVAPTLDHSGLRDLIDATSTVEPDGPEDLTGIGATTARAAQVLRTARSSSRAIVLFTDGEETLATADRPAEISPLEAAALCREFGVRLYALEVGPAATLDSVARITGGRAFDAANAAALRAALLEIDRLERGVLTDAEHTLVEQFSVWLLGALVCAVGAWIAERSPIGVAP